MSVSKGIVAGMILLAIAGAVHGQKDRAAQTRASIQQVVYLPVKTIRLDSLGAIVARQTGFIFSFNARKIDPGKQIALPGKPLTVQALLQLLSSRHQLRYSMGGNYIIFQREKNKQPPLRHKPVVIAPGRSGAAQPGERLATRSLIVSTAHRPGDSLARPSLIAFVPVRPDTVRGPGVSPGFTTLPPQGASVKSFRRRPPATPAVAVSPAASRRESRSGGGGSRFFAAAGLAVDDVFYASATVQAGLPWLYLTAKWNTNFDINGFSYGVGSSFRLADDWNAAVEVTMGALSRSYAVSGSFADTLRTAISIKGSLMRLSLQAERQLGNRWLLRAGPVVNLLRTAYYHKGKAAALSDYYPPGTDIERNYYLVKPLYTISNSYKDDATSNNKLWVGGQLTLVYRIPSFKGH